MILYIAGLVIFILLTLFDLGYHGEEKLSFVFRDLVIVMLILKILSIF